MIITVDKSANHAWAGTTLEVADGVGLSMIRRGLATKGDQLDTPKAKPSARTKELLAEKADEAKADTGK